MKGEINSIDAVSPREKELGIDDAELVVYGRSTQKNPLQVLFRSFIQLL